MLTGSRDLDHPRIADLLRRVLEVRTCRDLPQGFPPCVGPFDCDCGQFLAAGEPVATPDRGVSGKTLDKRAQPPRARLVDLTPQILAVPVLEVRLKQLPALCQKPREAGYFPLSSPYTA